MASRTQHERQFRKRAFIPNGERLYFLEIPQKLGWKDRYFKKAGAAKRTLCFWQAIYDSSNRIAEIHEKFPADRGHQPMKDSQQ